MFSVLSLDFQCSYCVLTDFFGMVNWCVHRKSMLMLKVGYLGYIGQKNLGSQGLRDLLGLYVEKKGRLHEVSSYKSGDEPGVVGSQE